MKKKHRIFSRGSGTLILIVAAVMSVPVAAECWESHTIGPACEYSTCNPNPCEGIVVDLINESVTIAVSNGNRTSRTDINYLCLLSWTEKDPTTGNCNHLKEYETIVSGSLAHGGICAGPIG